MCRKKTANESVGAAGPLYSRYNKNIKHINCHQYKSYNNHTEPSEYIIDVVSVWQLPQSSSASALPATTHIPPTPALAGPSAVCLTTPAPTGSSVTTGIPSTLPCTYCPFCHRASGGSCPPRPPSFAGGGEGGIVVMLVVMLSTPLSTPPTVSTWEVVASLDLILSPGWSQVWKPLARRPRQKDEPDRRWTRHSCGTPWGGNWPDRRVWCYQSSYILVHARQPNFLTVLDAGLCRQSCPSRI